MRSERAALMPDWPARMGEEMAALYLGVSVPTLQSRIKAGVYPSPVREGGRTFWSKHQLDAFVDAQFGFALSKNSWD